MPSSSGWKPADPPLASGTGLSEEVGSDLASILDLEFLASEPYTRFVFSTVEQALAVREYLLMRDLCEFSPPHLRVLRQGGRVVGMLAGLTGAELAGRRLRAALAITRSGVLAADPGLGARLQLAGQTLLKPGASDYYISRVATAASARGRGFGRLLMDEAEREARARGCRRVVLEVAPDSTAALRLYGSRGFRQTERRRVADPATGRVLEYLHLERVLDPGRGPAAPVEDEQGASPP